MAKISRFEDLQSWQKGRQLTNYVYDLTEHPKFAKDFRLCGQIQDAAGSIMHNIAEGFDSGTNPEFIRFLKMSRRSASEVQSELYLALDRKYISQDELTVSLSPCNRNQKTHQRLNRLPKKTQTTKLRNHSTI